MNLNSYPLRKGYINSQLELDKESPKNKNIIFIQIFILFVFYYCSYSTELEFGLKSIMHKLVIIYIFIAQLTKLCLYPQYSSYESRSEGCHKYFDKGFCLHSFYTWMAPSRPLQVTFLFFLIRRIKNNSLYCT